jgi:hypothetical protein
MRFMCICVCEFVVNTSQNDEMDERGKRKTQLEATFCWSGKQMQNHNTEVEIGDLEFTVIACKLKRKVVCAVLVVGGSGQKVFGCGCKIRFGPFSILRARLLVGLT